MDEFHLLRVLLDAWHDWTLAADEPGKRGERAARNLWLSLAGFRDENGLRAWPRDLHRDLVDAAVLMASSPAVHGLAPLPGFLRADGTLLLPLPPDYYRDARAETEPGAPARPALVALAVPPGLVVYDAPTRWVGNILGDEVRMHVARPRPSKGDDPVRLASFRILSFDAHLWVFGAQRPAALCRRESAE